MSKLENIIKEIGDRQMMRFIEKSEKHQPGTKYDLASDNFDWDIAPSQYWENEIKYHYQKWLATASKESNGREPNALLDLMNVIVARIHKLELEALK